MSDAFEQAKTFFLRGLEESQHGRWAEAEKQFEASLALLPGRLSTLLNLGIARQRQGRCELAIEPLQEVVAKEPDNATAWLHLGLSLAELQRRHPALEALDRALAIAPDVGLAWSVRGDLCKELGRTADAIAAYRKALDLGFEPELHRYYLAGLEGSETPQAAPLNYVRQLFDGYAADFEKHLVEVLGYKTPQLLVEGLEGRQFEAVLDMGCGTGLAAPLLRPLARRLDGIDLSPEMVRQARERKLYDDLAETDLVSWLESGRRYDLLFAADVFVYVGALERVFEAAARAILPGGTFCLSVEAADEQDLELRSTLRYAHSERYIRMLAGQTGFELRRCTRHPLRIDQGRPLEGLLAWMTMPARAA
jgi:predicted TPR repeat methyltransferase